MPRELPLPAAEFERLLVREAPRFRLDLPADAASVLARYLACLDAARRRTNLTGKLSAADLAAHALESAFGGARLPQGARAVDVGSGAGFPGLPLAIVRPDLSVTAVEPRRLRADFLREALQAAPIPNASVHQGRVSGLPAASAGAALSRAVGDIAAILLREGAFLERGGLYLAWTTEPEELSRALAPAYSLEAVDALPGSDRKAVAVFRKN